MKNLFKKLSQFNLKNLSRQQLSLLAIIAIVIALPITIIATQQRTNVQQHASVYCPPDNFLKCPGVDGYCKNLPAYHSGKVYIASNCTTTCIDQGKQNGTCGYHVLTTGKKCTSSDQCISGYCNSSSKTCQTAPPSKPNQCPAGVPSRSICAPKDLCNNEGLRVVGVCSGTAQYACCAPKPTIFGGCGTNGIYRCTTVQPKQGDKFDIAKPKPDANGHISTCIDAAKAVGYTSGPVWCACGISGANPCPAAPKSGGTGSGNGSNSGTNNGSGSGGTSGSNSNSGSSGSTKTSSTNLGTCTGVNNTPGVCTTDSSKGVVQYTEKVASDQCSINATKAGVARGSAIYCCQTGTAKYGTCGATGKDVCTTSCSKSNISYTGTTEHTQCGINATKAGVARGTTVYCVCTGTNCPSPSISPIATPSGTTTIALKLVLGLSGIGFNGNNPQHTTRNITVELYVSGTQNPGGPGTIPVSSATGTVVYNNGSDNNAGYFVSNTPVTFSNVAAGDYEILVKVPQYLYKLAVNSQNTDNQNVFTLSTNATTVLTPLILVPGDVAITNGQINHLNITDYNAILSCYGSNLNTSSCTQITQNNINLADLNDDGKVTIVDLNIWLRSLALLQTNQALGCDTGDCQGD